MIVVGGVRCEGGRVWVHLCVLVEITREYLLQLATDEIVSGGL